jgi:predicted amidophosphoribosyltransferase
MSEAYKVGICTVCKRPLGEHPEMGNCGRCGQPLVEVEPYVWTCPPCKREIIENPDLRRPSGMRAKAA